MGCNGSKPAAVPKSDVASSTLLTNLEEPKGEAPATEASAPQTPSKEVAAKASAEEIRETTKEVPAAQGSVPGTTTKEVAANATAKKAGEHPKEVPADAIAAKVVQAAETQEAPKPTMDVTVTKAEREKSEEAATEEGSATGLPGQAHTDKTTTSPEEVLAAEKMVAEKAAEADAASKEEVAESTVSVATVDSAVAGKQGVCFSYCTTTEAQNEIVVQN